MAVVAGCAVSLAMVLAMGLTFHPGSLAAILDARSRAVRLPWEGWCCRTPTPTVMPAAVMSQSDGQGWGFRLRAIVTRKAI